MKEISHTSCSMKHVIVRFLEWNEFVFKFSAYEQISLTYRFGSHILLQLAVFIIWMNISSVIHIRIPPTRIWELKCWILIKTFNISVRQFYKKILEIGSPSLHIDPLSSKLTSIGSQNMNSKTCFFSDWIFSIHF